MRFRIRLRYSFRIRFRYGYGFWFKFTTDPLFYFTIALYAGEASLSYFGLPLQLTSSVMYACMLIGFIFLLYRLKLYYIRTWDPVIIFYIYILLRNITFNDVVLVEFWLPNFFTLVLFILLTHIRIRRGHIERFVTYTYGFLKVLMTLGVLKALFVGGRLAVFGGPNGFYKYALFFECISFMKLVHSKKKRYLLSIALSIILTLMTGSKASLISIILILAVECFIYLAQNTKFVQLVRRSSSLVLLAALITILFFQVVPYFPSLMININRELGIFSSARGDLTSVVARVRLIRLSKEFFFDSPVLGKGAMFMYFDTMGSLDPQRYAHNVFFEMLGEQGMIGFFFLLCILVCLGYTVLQIGLKDPYVLMLFLGFVIYFLGAQFSGNILDTKVALLFAEMIILYRRTSNRRVKRRFRVRIK